MNEKKPKKGHQGDDDGLFLVLDGIYKSACFGTMNGAIH